MLTHGMMRPLSTPWDKIPEELQRKFEVEVPKLETFIIISAMDLEDAERICIENGWEFIREWNTCHQLMILPIQE